LTVFITRVSLTTWSSVITTTTLGRLISRFERRPSNSV
jgi:hypothetical protein